MDEISNASNFSHSIRLWNPPKSNCFQFHFNMDRILEIIQNYLTNIGSLQQSEMDDIVMQIGQEFEKCAEESFGYVGQGKIKQNMDTTKKPWFKENCYRAHQYHTARRYNNNKSEYNKQILKRAGKWYKSTMNLSINKFKSLRIQKLRNLKSSNPREFLEDFKLIKPEQWMSTTFTRLI